MCDDSITLSLSIKVLKACGNFSVLILSNDNISYSKTSKQAPKTFLDAIFFIKSAVFKLLPLAVLMMYISFLN
jgi:hypothetical protein